MAEQSKVMVFGVFDGLHEGHRFFLRSAEAEAKATQDHLIVVVARDATVQKLKQKPPQHSQEERMTAVQDFLPDSLVILGDERQGTYDVIKTHQPAMICLGHDQEELAKDLQAKINSGDVDIIQLKTLRELP